MASLKHQKPARRAKLVTGNAESLTKLRTTIRREVRWVKTSYSESSEREQAYLDGTVDGLEGAIACLNDMLPKWRRPKKTPVQP